MTGYGAPPQAYTRDTLIKAIDWIAEQPEHLRSQATNADALVALYLQFKRRNKASDTHPVSGEAFTQDLKNLAKNLEQFSAPEKPTNEKKPTPPQKSVPPSSPQQPVSERVGASPAFASSEVSQGASRGPQWNVDSLSWSQASALKKRLNLSDEGEALRMLIALGSEKLKSLLP